MRSHSLLAVAANVASITAHTIFVQLESGGTTYGVSYGIRDPSYDGPITDVTTNDLACNGGPNPTTASPYVIGVTAGSTVTAIWRHTLTSGADDVMDASHLGPTLAYLKKVDNATTDSGIGGGWSVQSTLFDKDHLLILYVGSRSSKTAILTGYGEQPRSSTTRESRVFQSLAVLLMDSTCFVPK